ncbi:MAG: ABC transporter permease [Cellvibrionales bacterium]|nr:ABC transporter permease [Cellvibrionales bacterium]
MPIKDQWVAFQTILFREIQRFTRIWVQTLLPPAITMGLYFAIFGKLMGSRIGEMQGVPYVQFVVPGLIMMAVITNSFSNVVSSFYSSKFQRHVEELLVSPVPNYIILAGYVAGGVARGLCVGLVVTILSLFFADLSVQNIGLTIVVLLLTSVFFASLGFLNALYANSFDDISVIPTFVLTPLIYLGGVFYSADMLSGFFKTASELNPMLYIVNAFRQGMIGVSDINVELSLGILFICCVTSVGLCLHLLKKGKGLRS